ncbi:sugar O-acetyltransferase [Lactiplantibacillus pentosus]|uniref:sugar O-acetyltransferase n=1 Tax=Lactiplantibacillus pentosus TaxID=1589 RepID=UPI000C7E1696|nr:sugar O-acetyltransferase [Lactiplantibacillus pentosus]MCE6031277.1 sugar O-acetyltransferase [Lactiplantibacillus pentosus]MCJ8184664.1 sugar O-acetyltransferase [Lactiplantibacillus pentosus]MCT0161683.1 sugar O-acetyltransferase [Lactiplantibacillus pentosus]MCT3065843.1 sugar O-acetyltransferase [Lactiplantibacillus pentosus]MCT3276176.1 sugar O-acetyltransferase [Lactiplantibacillus pentosus]
MKEGRLIEPKYLDKAQLAAIQPVIDENQRRVHQLNHTAKTLPEIRQILSEITGQDIDDSVEVRLPLWTDYGRNLRLGKRVYINDNVQITDLGGISLADDVLIGPGAMLLSVNHPLDPVKRRAVVVEPIKVERNAWIGAGAKILAGVTIGENAVVGAGAVVTKSVPANTVVAGVPAKVIKTIEG